MLKTRWANKGYWHLNTAVCEMGTSTKILSTFPHTDLLSNLIQLVKTTSPLQWTVSFTLNNFSKGHFWCCDYYKKNMWYHEYTSMNHIHFFAKIYTNYVTSSLMSGKITEKVKAILYHIRCNSCSAKTWQNFVQIFM